MKLVVVVIKPFKLQGCLAVLAELGVHQVVHSEARGYGRQKDHLQEYRDDRLAVAFLPKSRVEFVVEDDRLAQALEAVCQACRTGRQGDGKIWVLDARSVSPQAVAQ